MSPPLVFLTVRDEVFMHQVRPARADPWDGTWVCSCGTIFTSYSHRDYVACPRDVLWSRSWPGAYDWRWER